MRDLVDLILQYTRFDAARTLRSLEPGEMRMERFGESVAILDPAWCRP